MILKPNMILAGASSDKKIPSEEVAKLTLKCLKENVPSEVYLGLHFCLVVNQK